MRGRRFFAKVAVTGLLLSGLGIVAASQAMASGTYQVVGTGGASLNVRSCANTSCGVIKTLAAGSWHFIACQVEGQYVTAPNGVRSHIWDQTEGGYATDLFWNTPGVDTFSMSACGQPPAQTREQKAVGWARSMIGNTGYYFLCDRFVANAFGRTYSGYASAWAHAQNLTSRGLMHQGDTNVPFGALAFFRPAWVNGYYGHVMLSEGSGRFVSGGVSTVREVGLSSSFGSYYGWAWADPEWAGR